MMIILSPLAALIPKLFALVSNTSGACNSFHSTGVLSNVSQTTLSELSVQPSKTMINS